MLNDAHAHFFSRRFFETLAAQRGRGDTPEALCRELGWDAPADPEALADRWVQALDAHGVSRTTLIASLPGDEDSVARAVARHPRRFVGFTMVNPAADGAAARVRTATTTQGLRAICLFPAMHHVPVDDARTRAMVTAAADHGAAVFVHCGALSIGVRKKLGLPSPFDLRLGNPLAVARLAMDFPTTPFIVPHFGAGLFHDALMAADQAPNLYLDTSSSNGWIGYHPGLTLAAVFRAALAVAGPTRLLFGTDSSFFPRGWQQPIHAAQAAAVDEIGLSDADRSAVFGGNFNRLFESERT
jgi:hypothetical protein